MADAVQPVLYADPEDLDVPNGTFDSASDEDILAQLNRASREADSYLTGQVDGPGRFILPLKQWGEDLRAAVADIATYRIMRRVGFNPDGNSASLLREAYDDAQRWLRDVQSGVATPTGIIDSDSRGDDNQTAEEDATPPLLAITSRVTYGERCGYFWDHGEGPCFVRGPHQPFNRGW